MNYQEEYDLLVKMIDDTQKAIEKDPKDKLHLISELEALQNELAILRYSKISTKKPNRSRLDGFSFSGRRSA